MLTDAMVATIKDAAAKLRGRRKRTFQAKVTLDYLDGSARRAETVFGWGREAVQKGLLELQGRSASSDVSEHPRRDARGRPKTEERLSGLEADIRSLVDPQSQVDPKFQSAFAYTRMTAASVRQALIDRKGYSPDDKRMVEFADQTNLEIELIYYPPYHGKYNPIERCWGVLEMHWNGTLLDTVEKTLGWAKTMTWKGTQPVVRLLDRVYQTGVRLTKAALKPYQQRLRRSEALPKWSVSIQPQPPTLAVPR